MKKFSIIALGLLACLIWPFGYAEPWERSFQWSGEPWQFCGGACFLIPMVLMIAFWSVVIIGIVYFIKWVISSGKRHEIKQEESALDILKKRYARGEISREEFERMKQDIT
jgi:putative membrane protein